MKGKIIFQCTIMRGGTSKGIFLKEANLPKDPLLRDRIILAIFGSPDIRQVDGLGGADSLTSKLALVAPSAEPGRDINYTFGAVGIDKPFLDYSANCGNISSAVGPYTIDQGWVKAEEPFTTVRVFNANTRKMIHAKVPVKRGKVISEGEYAIDGVPGTGAKIELSFMDPGGALTGRLLPTGNAVDEIVLETGEKFFVTVVDAGNPTAFILSEDLGLKGTELPEFLEGTPEIKSKVEALRKKVGELSTIPFTPSIPKIAFVAAPQDYRTIAGKAVRKDQVNILARLMAMGKLHKAFAITAGVPAAAASVIPGSIVHRVMAGTGDDPMVRRLVIGHPSGQMDVGVEARKEEGQVRIVSCTIGRTARKIMEGRVYVPKKVYQLKD